MTDVAASGAAHWRKWRRLARAGVATDAGATSLRPGAQPVPDDIDREIARRMLRSMRADR